jgi:hypothetical protein
MGGNMNRYKWDEEEWEKAPKHIKNRLETKEIAKEIRAEEEGKRQFNTYLWDDDPVKIACLEAKKKAHKLYIEQKEDDLKNSLIYPKYYRPSFEVLVVDNGGRKAYNVFWIGRFSKWSWGKRLEPIGYENGEPITDAGIRYGYGKVKASKIGNNLFRVVEMYGELTLGYLSIQLSRMPWGFTQVGMETREPKIRIRDGCTIVADTTDKHIPVCYYPTGVVPEGKEEI